MQRLEYISPVLVGAYAHAEARYLDSLLK